MPVCRFESQNCHFSSTWPSSTAVHHCKPAGLNFVLHSISDCVLLVLLVVLFPASVLDMGG